MVGSCTVIRLAVCMLLSLCVRFASCASCYRSFKKEDFPQCISLSATYALHWKLDGENVTFAIDVDETASGWIGLGVSEAGGMKGSDLWIIKRNSDGAWTVTDTYSEDFVAPVTDSSQDVLLVGTPVTNGNRIAAVISRKLSACDCGDLSIYANRTTPLVWAHAPAEGYHGSTNRGTLYVQLDETSVHSNEPVSTHNFTMPNVIVPPATTSYLCVNFKAPTAAAKQHVVEANFSIPSSLVHHLILFQCRSAPKIPVGQVYDCLDEMPAECLSFTLGWAPGVQPWKAPKEAGFPLQQYYALQIHYNNPAHLEGRTDNTTITVGYTSKLRAHDLGVLTLSQMNLTIPPGQPSVVAPPAVCPGECTSKFKQPLNVVSHVLHMHGLGKSIGTQRVRGGKELVPLGEKHRWDFNFQNFDAPNPGAEVIMPGDTLITTCTYDSTKRTTVTRFGGGTDAEMCFDFVVYYPAQDLDTCSPLAPGAAMCTYQGQFQAWLSNLTSPHASTTNTSAPTLSTNTSAPATSTVSAASSKQVNSAAPPTAASGASSGEAPAAGGPSEADMAKMLDAAVAGGLVVKYDPAKYEPGAFVAYKPADGCPEFLSAAGSNVSSPGGMAPPGAMLAPPPADSGKNAKQANGAVRGSSGVAACLAMVVAGVIAALMQCV